MPHQRRPLRLHVVRVDGVGFFCEETDATFSEHLFFILPPRPTTPTLLTTPTHTWWCTGSRQRGVTARPPGGRVRFALPPVPRWLASCLSPSHPLGLDDRFACGLPHLRDRPPPPCSVAHPCLRPTRQRILRTFATASTIAVRLRNPLLPMPRSPLAALPLVSYEPHRLTRRLTRAHCLCSFVHGGFGRGERALYPQRRAPLAGHQPYAGLQ